MGFRLIFVACALLPIYASPSGIRSGMREATCGSKNYTKFLTAWRPAPVLWALASDDKTVFVDVRQQNEVDLPPYLPREFIHIPVTMTDNTAVRAHASELPKDKHSPLVVYSGCFGGRAFVAKLAIERLGYKNCTNGGGIIDVISACNNQKRSLKQRVGGFLARIGSRDE